MVPVMTSGPEDAASAAAADAGNVASNKDEVRTAADVVKTVGLRMSLLRPERKQIR
jgi:hypothetical protein